MKTAPSFTKREVKTIVYAAKTNWKRRDIRDSILLILICILVLSSLYGDHWIVRYEQLWPFLLLGLVFLKNLDSNRLMKIIQKMDELNKNDELPKP
jgi:hypothetical protein